MATRQARQKVAKLYAELRARSVGYGAAFVESVGGEECIVEVVRSQSDLQRFAEIKTSFKYTVDAAGSKAKRLSTVPQERSKTVMMESTSPSGKLQFRARAGEKDEKELWLEVWGDAGLVTSVKASDKTSKLYGDDLFGGVSWNVAETKCCFVGENPAPKKYKSYFEREEASSKEKNTTDERTSSKEAEEETWFEKKYEYKEDFGETLEGKVDPAVFVLDIARSRVDRLRIKGGFYPQQPVFDEADGIVFQGVELPVKKLGLNFCLNHKTLLYHIPSSARACEADTLPTALTPQTSFLAFNARFSKDKSKLVFFGREEPFVSHSGNYELFYIDWKTKGPPMRVVRRYRPYPSDSSSFAGLFGYHSSFALANFVADSNSLFLLQSQCKGRNRIYAVDVNNGTVAWLNLMGTESGECEMLALRDNRLVFKYHSFNQAPSVHLATFFFEAPMSDSDSDEVPRMSRRFSNMSQRSELQGSGASPTYTLLELEGPAPFPSSVTSEVEQQVFRLDNGAEAYVQYNAKVAKESGPLPSVVILHGGPFGSSPRDAFLLQRNMFVAMGYATVVINYRGSTGYGEAFLDALLGNIGLADVQDCGELVIKVLGESRSLLDPARVAVYGGSHGGFLTGWMIGGEYRNLFKCACLWNPVLNISYNAAATDIPDWVSACVENKSLDYAYTSESNTLFFERSPFAVVQHVSCPTMLVVGESDKRVPPHQSYAYFNTLKSRKVDVSMYVYPDEGHAISKNQEKSTDANLNIFFHFDKYLSRD